jgi:putative inorganic carbon (HCO3(-)) transporter
MSVASATDRRFGIDVPMRAPWLALGVAVSLCAVAGLVLRVGAVPVLALMLAALAALVMLVRPEVATLLTAFLLYTNFPAILTKQVGLPAPAAGAFILLLGFPLVHTLVVRRERFRADVTFGLMLVFLGLLLLSTFEAVDTGIALDRAQQYFAEGVVLYWLVLNAVRDLATLRKLFWVVLIAGSFLSTLCLYQDLTGSYRQEFGGLAYRHYDESRDSSLTVAVQRRQTWDRAQGPVDEPNRFAQIMIVLVPLAGFMCRNARSRAQQLSAAALGALTLTGVALTLSRGAFVTLALMAVAMVFLRWIRPWQVLTGVLALAAVAPVISPFLLQRLASIADAGHLLGRNPSSYQEADGAIRGRTTEMLAAMRVFRDHPVLGVGPGQFSRFYFQDYNRSADLRFRDVEGPRRAHNLYLELGAEYGAPGLATFLAMVALLMRGLSRARLYWRGKSDEAADLAAALWLSLFVYLCTGLFLHLSYERYYWFLLAVASGALHLLHPRRWTLPARVAGDGSWHRLR